MTPKTRFANHMRDKYCCHVGPAYIEALDLAIREIKRKFARRIDKLLVKVDSSDSHYDIAAKLYKDIFKESHLDLQRLKK
jgi:hypothetical protein